MVTPEGRPRTMGCQRKPKKNPSKLLLSKSTIRTTWTRNSLSNGGKGTTKESKRSHHNGSETMATANDARRKRKFETFTGNRPVRIQDWLKRGYLGVFNRRGLPNSGETQSAVSRATGHGQTQIYTERAPQKTGTNWTSLQREKKRGHRARSECLRTARRREMAGTKHHK